MTTKRKASPPHGDRRRRSDGAGRTTARRPADAPPSRAGRRRSGKSPAAGREPQPQRSGPQTKAAPRPSARPASPKNSRQAKARAKARKAKAPKVVRVPLRERLILRLASVDLRPRTLAAKVPFVVLIIGSLGVGLGVTLWLSTDAAERSYQLGNIRQENRALLQQREALERDVRNAQSAPALAEAARNLGMIPSKDTAHLVKDPAGNWVVVGSPKPAEGAPPPPLNTKLPEEQPARPPIPPANPVEVPVRMPRGAGIPGSPATGPEVLERAPQAGMAPGIQHLPGAGPVVPGAVDLPPAGLPPVPPSDLPQAPVSDLPAPGLPPVPASDLAPLPVGSFPPVVGLSPEPAPVLPAPTAPPSEPGPVG